MRQAKKAIRSGRFLERLADSLDIPRESLPGESGIIITGTRSAVISGCTGVLEYGKERITVRTTTGRISISGSRLEIQSLIEDRITVFGCLASVALDAKTTEAV